MGSPKKNKPATPNRRRPPQRSAGSAAGAREISGRTIEASITYHAEPPSPGGPKKIHRRRPLPPVPDRERAS